MRLRIPSRSDWRVTPSATFPDNNATYSDILDFVKKQWYNKDIGEYVRSRFRFSEMISRYVQPTDINDSL